MRAATLWVYFALSFLPLTAVAEKPVATFPLATGQDIQPTQHLSAARTSHRVALVIGNAEYLSSKVLKNPIKDAELVAKTLEKLGFEVTLLRNTDRLVLVDAVEDFGRLATGADAALFYFSGHGVQDAFKKNYLIPVDANIRGEAGVRNRSVEADFIVETLTRAAPRVGLIMLDACRDTPFPSRQKSSSRGLARMDVKPVGDTEILIHFATREGDTADDGTGNNSPYAQALARQLPLAGRQSIRGLLDNVGDDVSRITAGEQHPVQFGEMRISTYLVTPEVGVNQPNTMKFSPPLIGQDDLRWKAIVDSLERSDFESFLRQYPRSQYATLAKSRILQINEQVRLEGVSRDQQAWLKADLTGTEAAYFEYLRSFPSGFFVKQSNERLRVLRERAQASEAASKSAALVRADSVAWDLADRTDTLDGFQLYLSRYPSGRFVSVANARVRFLQEQTQLRRQQEENAAQEKSETEARERRRISELNRQAAVELEAAKNKTQKRTTELFSN